MPAGRSSQAPSVRMRIFTVQCAGCLALHAVWASAAQELHPTVKTACNYIHLWAIVFRACVTDSPAGFGGVRPGIGVHAVAFYGNLSKEAGREAYPGDGFCVCLRLLELVVKRC